MDTQQNDRIPEKDILQSLIKLIKIRRTLAKDFLKFREQYFAHYHKVPDGVMQKELSELLYKASTVRGSKLAIAAPRGFAKSTIVSLEYVIYCICYKLEDFIVIISNTADQATGFLNDVKQELQTNELLIRDFPDVCEVGTRPGPPRWTQREIVTRNNVKILGLGTGQQLRGRRNRQARPTLIILDDIENDESAQNPDNYYKLEDWLTKAVLKAGSAVTNIVFVGTIHHFGSLLARFTDSKQFPGWKSKIFRSVISWAERSELWQTWQNIFRHKEGYGDESGPEAARRFFETNEKDMLKGTEVLWPERKSYYELMVMRETEGAVSFDSEMQNMPVNPRDCFFKVEDLHYWDDVCKTEEELLRALGDDVFFFGACDPSMGRDNKNSDYSAIITLAKDTKTGAIYVLDADVERRLPDKTIEAILFYQGRRRYRKFGFEANNFQEFMAMELAKRSEASGTYLKIEEIKHSSDKRARIEAMQPLVNSGTIRFSRKHRILLEQMKYFPKGAHDDAVDALEMAAKLAMTSRKRLMTTLYEGGRVEVLYNE